MALYAYIDLGQSNSSQRGINNQAFVASNNQTARKISIAGAVTEMFDPVGTDAGAMGSCYPLWATMVMASGDSVIVANRGVGGTSIVEWEKGHASGYYAAIAPAKGFLDAESPDETFATWCQGEADPTMPFQEYKDRLNAIVNNIFTDFGIRTYIVLTPQGTATSEGFMDIIRAAQQAVADENPNALFGGDWSVIDIDTGVGVDHLHINTDIALQEAALIRYNAMNSGSASGVGTMSFDGSLFSSVQVTAVANPTSTLGGFKFLIDKDCVPAWCLDGGADSALNGGGDIRIALDDAGVNQVPCDIVSCVTDANPANTDLEVHFLADADDTTAPQVYFFCGKSDETLPAHTAPEGRNATWTNYGYVNHFKNSESGALNSKTGVVGTWTGVEPTVAVGQVGDGKTFTGTQRLNSGESLLGSSPGFTLTQWVSTSSSGDLQNLCSIWFDPNYSLLLAYHQSVGEIRFNTLDNAVRGGNFASTALVVDERTHVAARLSGGILEVAINGVVAAQTYTSSALSNATPAQFVMGMREQGDRAFDGMYDEARVSNIPLSNDWLAYEVLNQSNPSAFWTTGTEKRLSLLATATVSIDIRIGTPASSTIYSGSFDYVIVDAATLEVILTGTATADGTNPTDITSSLLIADDNYHVYTPNLAAGKIHGETITAVAA